MERVGARKGFDDDAAGQISSTRDLLLDGGVRLPCSARQPPETRERNARSAALPTQVAAPGQRNLDAL